MIFLSREVVCHVEILEIERLNECVKVNLALRRHMYEHANE